MRNTILAIILLFSMSSYSGNKWNDIVQQNLPKSPEAAAYDKVTDIPVSMYNGRADISIPLYTVTSGDISLPISLDYDGGAIRVDQEATWVGLNWNLNAGGCITVNSVAGHSNRTKSYSEAGEYEKDWDFVFNKMNLSTGYACGGEFRVPYKFDGLQPMHGGYGRNWFPGTVIDSRDMSRSTYDEILNYHNGERAVYHAVFMGNSLTFVWDPFKGEFFQTGLRKNFRISGSPGSEITITDGKGILYTFYFYEKIFPVGNNVDMDHFSYDGTYYLTSISSPSGHSIRLLYTEEAGYYPVRHITEKLYDGKFPFKILFESYGSYTDILPSTTVDNLSLVRSITPYYCISKYRIKSILADSVTVNFNANTPRKDLNYGQYKGSKGTINCLDNIEIYKTEKGNKVRLKKYVFNYSYFQKNETGGNTLKDYWHARASEDVYSQYYPNDDYVYLRLRLDKLTEYGSDGSSKPSYMFGYNPGGPGKNSASQDYWGYYNGSENCNGVADYRDLYSGKKRYHTMLPRHYEGSDDGYTDENDLKEYLSVHGADRRSDYRYATAGMLSTIKYPTGGWVRLSYRQNTFYNHKYESADTAEYIPTYFDKKITVYETTTSHTLTVKTCDHEKYEPVTQRGINSSLFNLDKSDSLEWHTKYSNINEKRINSLIGHRAVLYKVADGQSSSTSEDSVVSSMVLSEHDGNNGGSPVEYNRTIFLNAGKYRLVIDPLADDKQNVGYGVIESSLKSRTANLTYDVKTEDHPYHYGEPVLGLSSTFRKPVPTILAYQSNNPGCSIPDVEPGSKAFLIEKPLDVNINVGFCLLSQRIKPYWKDIQGEPVMILHYDIMSTYYSVFEYVCDTKAITISPDDSANTNITKNLSLKLSPGRYVIVMPNLSKEGKSYEITVRVSIDSKYKNMTNPSYGNGVCVSSVERFDNGAVSKTCYSYSNDGLMNTTGKLSAASIFFRKKMLVYQQESGGGGMQPDQYAKDIVYSYASSENQNSNIGMVGYDRVDKISHIADKDYSRETLTFWNRAWADGEMWLDVPAVEDPRNGLVLADSICTSDGRGLKSAKYAYKILNTENRLINARVENLYYGPTAAGNDGLNRWALLTSGIMDICLYSNAQFAMESSSATTSYICDNGTVAKKKETKFCLDNGLPAKETEQTSVMDGNIVTERLYPCNFNNLTIIEQLKKAHINEVPLQTSVYIEDSKNSVLRSSTVVKYNSKGQPTDYYTKDIGGAIPESTFATTDKNGFNLSGYTRRLSISYDGSSHNPVSFTDQGGLRTELAWGYHNLYPVAVTVGNQTTRYEYEPYVGMTKMTLPNGNTESYSYDGFQRLAEVKGIDGVTHRYSYHYGQNYIKHMQPLNASGSATATTIQYYDGLGRPTLSASDGIGGNGTGVYTLKTYDGLDRAVRESLPAVGNGGTDYMSSKDFPAISRATYNDSHAYSETSYDALGRPVYTRTAGDAWHYANKGVAREHITNGKDDVRLFTAPMDGTNHMVKSGYYAPYTLFGERTIDEDGHSLTVFTDKLGQKVLERRASEQGNNDTYFVYNDLGQLRFVLSPEYQNDQRKAIFGYEYRYDKRGNIVKKILPQCQYTQYWYDNGDKVIFMQDANLRSKNKYRFMLYDRLGRLCVQGLCDDFDRSVNVSHINISVVYNQGADGLCNTGYVLNQALGLKDARLEKAYYYDNYDFLSGGRKAAFREIAPTLPGFSSVNTNGLLTGTVLSTSDGHYLYEVKAYDRKGRKVETRSTTANGSVEDCKSDYTFTDNIAKQTVSVNKGGSFVVSSATTNEYNCHNNRVAAANIIINDGAQQKACGFRYDYDDLGRLKRTYRPYKAGDVEYGYNLRGWTTSVSTPTFTEKLYYADDISYGKHYYNGNISAQRWTNGNYGRPRWYKFSYDMLNRLTDAEYSETDSHEECQNYYDESVLEYDANGNIERLQRRGRKQDGHVGKIDNLHIYHNGNQLDMVQDDADKIYYAGIFNFNGDAENVAHYKYNESGSLTEDTGRGITNIEYDDWNNPKRIQFANGNVTKYVYSADGQKLRTVHYTAAPNITVAAGQTHELSKDEILSIDSTDYIGRLVLKNGKPDMYLFAGGYYKYQSSDDATASSGNSIGGLYFYNYDHLGNVREVVNEDGKLLQVNNYYPFGAPYSDNRITSMNPKLQPYKYTGKELDLVHGLNTYDHGARQNYSALGVWDRVDPLAEKYYNMSPYAVCGDNPQFIIDSKGDTLTMLGAQTDVNSAIDIYNKGLGEFYTVSANDKGNLSIQAVEGTDPSKMSSSQKTVFEKLKTIIDDEGNTILNVTNNSEETLIGDISKHEIDVGDMQQLKNQKELNDVSSMMHETYENYQVQVLGLNIRYAHKKASELEYFITDYFIRPFERNIDANSLKLHIVIPMDYYKYIRIKNNNIVPIK